MFTNVRRMTLLILFVVPMLTLFLMMMGIALTHAAVLQKAAGQRPAATQDSHPATVDISVDQAAADPQGPSIVSTPVSSPFAFRTETTVLILAVLPLAFLFLFQWLVRRSGQRSGVGEGSLGSSSASSR